MSFSFLAPLFAAGLLAIGIPLLVHLVHKERKESVAFPSLMFVERTPYQHSSRQRIRDWLLFAARCLVIALAAAAFMRPVVARPVRPVTGGAGGREVVVLLDRSLSMAYGTRWATARRMVRERIASLVRTDRLTLVPFDVRASAVNEATAERLALGVALDSLRTVDTGTRLAPAVALARRILSASKLPGKEVMIVSDFQRSAWDLGDEVRMPVGTTIVPMDVATDAVSDRSVRGVEIRRDVKAPNDRVIVTARVVNVGSAVKGVGVRLEVSGRTLERRTLDVPADGGATVAFASVPVPSERVPARVVIDPDAFTGDDAFHFVLARAPAIAVLLVDHRNAVPERAVFVARALAIGDQPAFDIKAVRSDRATPVDLAGRRLVILNDAGVPPGVGATALMRFVRSGGGLVNALGEHASPRTWPTGADSLLPGSVGTPLDRLGEKGAVLGYLDRSHPALAVFGGARSGDLSAARFFRYRPIAATNGVLARFDDGTAAVVEHRIGRGRVLTWGSSFDGSWNDLPRQAVFLPFLQQLARYAASYRERRASYTVGDGVDVGDAVGDGSERPRASTGERYSVRAPSGARLAVGGADAPGALEVREAGFYEVRRSGAPNERARIVAANPPARELEFASFDPLRLSGALAPEPLVASTETAADPAVRFIDQEREQSLWWYLLVVAALVLLAEGVLASRASQRRIQPR